MDGVKEPSYDVDRDTNRTALVGRNPYETCQKCASKIGSRRVLDRSLNDAVSDGENPEGSDFPASPDLVINLRRQGLGR
jgi:hypothetical protein